MHSHPHPHPAGSRAVRVQVVTVSTSRTAVTDVSGPLLRELVGASGHVVAGHTLVTDDPVIIQRTVAALLETVDVEAIVLTGGTGISARDCTPAAIRPLLDRELPGFGELFRMLSFERVGAAAMLSSAIGGIARGRPVFALPGSPDACRLAMERLILPELGHLVNEVSKETPLPTAAKAAPSPERATTPSRGTTVTAKAPKEEAPEKPQPVRSDAGTEMMGEGSVRPAEEEIATGWLAGMRALKGQLRRGSLGEIPSALERFAPVVDVLRAAGDRAEVVLPNGRVYAAFGYPDLVRNASKVILVGEGSPIAEIVALHRWPRRVGVCVEGDDGVLPSADLDPAPVAMERTGAPFDGAGQLFAVEMASIYVSDSRRVAQWDGRALSVAEPTTSMLGTLLLHWSQR